MEPLEHIASQAYARVAGDKDAFWDAVRKREAQEADDEHSPGGRFASRRCWCGALQAGRAIPELDHHARRRLGPPAAI